MFAIKRYSQKTSSIVNFIYSSSVVRCESSKNSKAEAKKKEEKKETSEKKNTAVQAKERLQSVLNEFISSVESRDGKNERNIKLSSPKRKKSSKKKPDFQKKLTQSVNTLVSGLGEDKKQVKADLLQSVKAILEVKEPKKEEKKSMASPPPPPSPPPLTKEARKDISEKMQSLLSGFKKESSYKKTDSYDSYVLTNQNCLGIFTSDLKPQESKLKVWKDLREKDLEIMATLPPTNYYEELIQWTNEGKIWHFPIDNDQGRHDEAKFHFTEHIFLEEYLEPWCPKSGPLRHFMELVLAGITKNPTLSVKDKVEHIYWYRDYFEKQKNLLTEIGAYKVVEKIESSQDSN